MNQPIHSELGKNSSYDKHYNPERLFAIDRAAKREEIGIDPLALPFYGFDCWNHYEVSWLNNKGKPVVALAEIVYDCASLKIVESKSLKLYFNSFNQACFASFEAVSETIQRDLEALLDITVNVTLYRLDESNAFSHIKALEGECIDECDVECSRYSVYPEYLFTGNETVSETIYSHLLKSNCLVTNQPDWGSVSIQYQGKKIDREGLLQYIVSFRLHNEFHEQCIERIFMDIMLHCQPAQLSVHGRYTRRGGLDINPFRSTEKASFTGRNQRLIRQ